jgi:Domain of unknown function DUF29
MPLAKEKERPAAPPGATYDGDFYGWALEQAALIRRGRFDEIDTENVAEEIESLARNEFRRFVSFLRLVIVHLLKWDHQPQRRTRGWAISIALHRDHARTTLDENPSFGPRLEEALDRAYRLARLQAARETKLPIATFSERRLYSFDDVMSRPIPIDDEG